ncbi:hypothetical protein HDU93_009952 [Gonapodya sp. JEL0774]|nr:hypothetical protein HDU93_009952 [Gonapodya sp. JEL0774]
MGRIRYHATYVTGGVRFFLKMGFRDGDGMMEELFKFLDPHDAVYKTKADVSQSTLEEGKNFLQLARAGALDPDWESFWNAVISGGLGEDDEDDNFGFDNEDDDEDSLEDDGFGFDDDDGDDLEDAMDDGSHHKSAK